jgi:asparagine synthase (glutamine-hydrolysing)
MDGITGVFTRRGAPIASNVMGQIVASMVGSPNVRASVTVPERVAMAHVGTRPTAAPAEHYVTQGSYGALALMGRVDNLPDLRRSVRGRCDRRAGSAEVLLHFYMEGGVEALGQIVGDFALSLWDDRRQTLVLCGDGLGRRRLYYRVTDELVLWASQSRPLLLRHARLDDVDEEFVADFLANTVPRRSPYRSVEMLGAGEVFVVNEQRGTRRRYWALDPSREVRFGSDAEYEEAFREIFTEAVRCRVEGSVPVLCELSGGLDSTSIACVAQGLITRGAVRTPYLQTISQVYLDAPTSDEREFVHIAAQAMSRPNIEISERECPLLQPLPEKSVPDHPTNSLVCLGYRQRLSELTAEHGAAVLLAGIGGDQLFLSQPIPGFPLADLVAQGRWVSLLRECGRWAKHHRIPVSKTLWLGGVVPFLPRRVRAAVQRGYEPAPWIDAGFSQRTAYATRQLPMRDDLGFRLPTSARQYGAIRHTMRPFTLDRFAPSGYLDVQYPYLDRRLVEFALAIPLDQKLRIGETRSLVRRALRGVVPDPVLDRRSKAGPDEALFRAINREWPRLSTIVATPLVAELGLVNGPVFAAELRRAANAGVYLSGQLMCTLSLELWLRALRDLSRERSPVIHHDVPRTAGAA